jgi:hypothetical protein
MDRFMDKDIDLYICNSAVRAGLGRAVEQARVHRHDEQEQRGGVEQEPEVPEPGEQRPVERVRRQHPAGLDQVPKAQAEEPQDGAYGESGDGQKSHDEAPEVALLCQHQVVLALDVRQLFLQCACILPPTHAALQLQLLVAVSKLSQQLHGAAGREPLQHLPAAGGAVGRVEIQCSARAGAAVLRGEGKRRRRGER